jgi:hypothetical protein
MTHFFTSTGTLICPDISFGRRESLIWDKLLFSIFVTTFLSNIGDNILFTTRILKSASKNYDEIVKKSFKTGMTLVGTVMAAMAALLIISSSIVIDQIASVQLIGMSVDVLNSWALNLGLLLWFVTRKIK